MTISQAIKWTASKAAEDWIGRKAAVAEFEHLADTCAAIAQALETHRDVDANELFTRLQDKLDAAKKLAVFTGKK